MSTKPMFSKEVLKHWFWDSYDHLFVLIFGNIALFITVNILVILMAPLVFGLMAGLAPPGIVLLLFVMTVVVLPMVLAMIVGPSGYVAKMITEEKEPIFRDFFRGLRATWFRMWRFFAVVCAAFGILLVNAWFYLLSGFFPEQLQLLGGLLAGLCLWIALTLLCILQIAIPVYIRTRTGILKSLKTGFVALMKYPGLMIGNGVFLLSLGILSMLAMLAPILIYGFVGPIMLLNAMYDVLLEYEENLNAEERPTPKTWTEIEEREKEDENIRMKKVRYNRTIRDVLRPWQDS
ncbi:MAG: DUF624 domain-containing protein [Candidatus Sumerlaeia bacterium]|nr:DUF624 domain-containing protein [Candidatus Sumerlaeia bacterium]